MNNNKLEKSELKKEKEYLEKVKEVIREIISEASYYVENRKSEINQLKRFMWENLSDYTDEERAAALYEVDVDVDLTNQRIDRISKYEKALESPYFGKVVFQEEGYDDILVIYLGITSVEKGLDFYVYDWRAPISSLFYNFELGKASYETPNGEINGEILSKMQFKIVDSQLTRCFKCDISIDDEYLQEILATSSNDKMQNIVSTIQREQNEIIRNNKDKYLIVQGVAGSGKTSVALHRIAYLLYKDINLNSNNILIFSPNEVFSDYISDVLPELGEENVLKSTFSEFAQNYLKPYTKIESYSDFLERIYSNKDEDNQIIAYKMQSDFQKDIDLFWSEYEKNIKFNKGITIRGKTIDQEELQKSFSEKYAKLPISERIEAMAEDICYTAGIAVKKNLTAVKNVLCESSELNLDIFGLYQTFMKINNFDNDQYRLNGKIQYEDITGLLYLYFKMNGYPNISHIRHIVIDEAQDYTLLQMEMLRKIFSKASFTILGDINQTINPYYKYDSLEQLSSLFDNSRYIELSKTYRSSEEIIEYTNKILGINNACAIRKNNNIPVEITEISENESINKIKQDLTQMKRDGIKKIAIITRDVNQAMQLYKLLNKDDMGIQLIAKANNNIHASTILIPSYLSKGLEFDGVIAYSNNKDDYEEKEKNLYYVVCTRAQHKLNIYNEPSKILQKQNKK